jgi:hypothetical protein
MVKAFSIHHRLCLNPARADRFFCLWRSPVDDKSCAIQQDRDPQSVCDADPRLQLVTGVTNCDLVIREVQPEDFGRWLCLVNEPSEFTSDRATVSLEVGQQARVVIEAKGVDDKGQLTVTEGETVKVGAMPLTSISLQDRALIKKTIPSIEYTRSRVHCLPTRNQSRQGHRVS